MKLCTTCGTPHPDDVSASHHPEGCTCRSQICQGKGKSPDGCIWMRTVSYPHGQTPAAPPFIEYARLMAEREKARTQVGQEKPQ